MGGLRGGRGGGGGGGFEEESDSFEAMDDAKSLSDGCELFFGGGGGGGGDESVGCCVVASIFILVARRPAACDELCRASSRLALNGDGRRCCQWPLLSLVAAGFSEIGLATLRAQAEQWASSAATNVSQRPVDAAVDVALFSQFS